ncbi:hypothetical protein MGYG_09111 [Nannizzia gypsea CBS 118893]|uniref:Uncharacterized protein n=1 Tax=Arthroderma gypseum (strain ATCC MYA-4604 / CBS 118893) TaxID=535722 RepID=E4V0E7_ARTGP|nr:hypothetical protein MGYG_09111 [Nannizzia gypsea CBS 118893]EFR03084.1 hypothetical protein MGYG_09111 [Nannizzia gypsea CBS 118893]
MNGKDQPPEMHKQGVDEKRERKRHTATRNDCQYGPVPHQQPMTESADARGLSRNFKPIQLNLGSTGRKKTEVNRNAAPSANIAAKKKRIKEKKKENERERENRGERKSASPTNRAGEPKDDRLSLMSIGLQARLQYGVRTQSANFRPF